ncbi:MAG: lipoprotein-releasing ABC transporter permease subunit [Nitrospiria bacterium]
MSPPYEFFIGLRYLKAKRRRKGVSLNTSISIGGVTVGVAALIATLAVMTGFKEDLRDKILGTNSHIVITDRTRENIGDYQGLLKDVVNVPHVLAATPFIFRQVLLSSDINVFGVVLRGIDPEKEAGVTEVGRNIVEGKLDYLANRPPSDLLGDQPGSESGAGSAYRGIIIGKELAARLGVFWGDTINVISPVGKEGDSIEKSLGGAMGFTPKIRKFRVIGIFDSGMYEYDSSLAYISIKEAQRFFNLSDVVTGIEVKVDDISIADEVAQQLEARLDFPYQARDWMQLNRNLFSALELEKHMMFVILILIVLVASFNIVSTLTMTVVEKAREIAILKAMGATRKSIIRIFMLEGMIICGVGVILGMPLGLAICWVLQTFYTLPGDVYYISHLPVKLLPFDIILVSVSAVLIGLLATLYPSWQAARLDPVEALRYE